MLADAVVTASPIDGVVITDLTDPLDTINPADKSARSDRHSIFRILRLGLRLGMGVRNSQSETGDFCHTRSIQIVPLTSRVVRQR
jgi:hypothetical protein